MGSLNSYFACRVRAGHSVDICVPSKPQHAQRFKSRFDCLHRYHKGESQPKHLCLIYRQPPHDSSRLSYPNKRVCISANRTPRHRVGVPTPAIQRLEAAGGLLTGRMKAAAASHVKHRSPLPLRAATPNPVLKLQRQRGVAQGYVPPSACCGWRACLLVAVAAKHHCGHELQCMRMHCIALVYVIPAHNMPYCRGVGFNPKPCTLQCILNRAVVQVPSSGCPQRVGSDKSIQVQIGSFIDDRFAIIGKPLTIWGPQKTHGVRLQPFRSQHVFTIIVIIHNYFMPR